MLPIKEFITTIKDARDALLDIPRKLDSLRNSIENQRGAVNKASEAAQEHYETPPVVRAELHVPVSKEETNATESIPHKRREIAKVSIEAITMIAVICYACEAHKQTPAILDAARASKDSAYAARQTAAINQGAYLNIVSDFFGIPADPGITVGKPIEVRAQLSNVGSQDAYEVTYVMNVAFRTRDPQASDYAGTTEEINWASIPKHTVKAPFPTMTGRTPEPLSAPIAEETTPLYVWGVVTYSDITGRKPPFYFCVWTSAKDIHMAPNKAPFAFIGQRCKTPPPED